MNTKVKTNKILLALLIAGQVFCLFTMISSVADAADVLIFPPDSRRDPICYSESMAYRAKAVAKFLPATGTAFLISPENHILTVAHAIPSDPDTWGGGYFLFDQQARVCGGEPLIGLAVPVTKYDLITINRNLDYALFKITDQTYDLALTGYGWLSLDPDTRLTELDESEKGLYILAYNLEFDKVMLSQDDECRITEAKANCSQLEETQEDGGPWGGPYDPPEDACFEDHCDGMQSNSGSPVLLNINSRVVGIDSGMNPGLGGYWAKGIAVKIRQIYEEIRDYLPSEYCMTDDDGDRMPNCRDNCPDVPNTGKCSKGKVGFINCLVSSDCDSYFAAGDGECVGLQEDTDGNGVGDACSSMLTDSYEPNDLPSQAAQLMTGSYQLNIHNRLDTDFFLIPIPNNTDRVLIQAEIKAPYSTITRTLAKWMTYQDCDTCPSLLASGKFEMTGYGWMYEETGFIPAGRKYLLELYEGEQRGPFEYNLFIFTGGEILPPDWHEPNDSQDTATIMSGCDYQVNIHSGSDIDYYRIDASGWSVKAEITFDPSQGNLELFLHDVKATEFTLSSDGTQKTVRIIGCGKSPSYARVQGEANFYKICVTKVLLQEGCLGYNPLIPLRGSGTFIYTPAQYGPGSPPPEETAIIREQMQGHKSGETSNTVLWTIGAYLDFPGGFYLPLILEANCPKGPGSSPADIVAKILSQNLNYIVWSGSGQGKCFGTETPGVITGVSTVIDNMTTPCGFPCVVPGHGILTVNGTSEEVPVAEAGGPYSGTQGSPVTFDASGSSDPNGTIVLYEWDWNNDGIYDESTSLPGITHTWDSPYIGFVGLRVTDNDGFTGLDTTSVDIKSLSFRISGGAYFYPETPTYRATFSLDVAGPISPSGWLKYYYARTRMNFVSTGITSASKSGDSVTISGAGTVNGGSGYSFTATVTNGSPDTFGIVIKRSDGSTYYSAGPRNISGGDLTIQ